MLFHHFCVPTSGQKGEVQMLLIIQSHSHRGPYQRVQEDLVVSSVFIPYLLVCGPPCWLSVGDDGNFVQFFQDLI